MVIIIIINIIIIIIISSSSSSSSMFIIISISNSSSSSSSSNHHTMIIIIITFSIIINTIRIGAGMIQVDACYDYLVAHAALPYRDVTIAARVAGMGRGVLLLLLVVVVVVVLLSLLLSLVVLSVYDMFIMFDIIIIIVVIIVVIVIMIINMRVYIYIYRERERVHLLCVDLGLPARAPQHRGAEGLRGERRALLPGARPVPEPGEDRLRAGHQREVFKWVRSAQQLPGTFQKQHKTKLGSLGGVKL